LRKNADLLGAVGHSREIGESTAAAATLASQSFGRRRKVVPQGTARWVERWHFSDTPMEREAAIAPRI